MLKFCPTCMMAQTIKIVSEEETLNVKGVNITDVVDSYKCEVCGDEFADVALENANLKRYFAKYEEKVGRKVNE